MKIFELLRGCKYDRAGVNLDWKNLAVDLRADLRKFINESNPQWNNLDTQKTEEICRRIKSKII